MCMVNYVYIVNYVAIELRKLSNLRATFVNYADT